MKVRLFLFCFLASCMQAMAKDNTPENVLNIGFKVSDTSITRKGQSFTYPIIISNKDKEKIGGIDSLTNYKVKVSVETESNTIPLSSIELDNTTFSLEEFKTKNEHKVFLTVLADSLSDRERNITLTMEIIKLNESDRKLYLSNPDQKMKIILKGKSEQIKDYNVLAYLGSNFNMAEGKTQLQNLFFATNVFIPPLKSENNKVGFYLSLYGNRTMSTVDSTENGRRVYKRVKISDSTHWEHGAQQKLKTTRVSDNFGAYISPLFRFPGTHLKPNLNIYYAPSLEFVWRKTIISYEFLEQSNFDSVIVNYAVPGSMNFSNNFNKAVNEFAFNAGLIGLFLAYETPSISVRVHGSVGYSSIFNPQENLFAIPGNSTAKIISKSDIFFTGRAWITEPATGITLQAEVTNTAYNPRPFFGATLSKAFKLESLSGILSPITSRN